MPTNFEEQYSDDGFWEKVKAFALTAGREVIEKALTLYYVLQKPDLPVWIRATILGALGYFISPIDAIPDLTPVVGYADDLGVLAAALAAALAAVAMHIDDNVLAKVRAKMRQWFGDAPTA